MNFRVAVTDIPHNPAHAMTTTPSALPSKSKYHRLAYQFVLEALGRAQRILGRPDRLEEDQHVSGPELLQGFRDLAYEQFGGMALTVFRQWGLTSTNDVGHIVWELIERGNMRKTDQDQLTDFFDLYSFEEVFGERYPVNVSAAFQHD
jgi:uncharacterized repeat protein (TIGR04138 family)